MEKPKILSELVAQGYKVQEVNFHTMLSIVQSCQELQNERMNYSLKQQHNSKVPKEPKDTNIFTIFKGIVPGKLQGWHSSFILPFIVFVLVFCGKIYSTRNFIKKFQEPSGVG